MSPVTLVDWLISKLFHVFLYFLLSFWPMLSASMMVRWREVSSFQVGNIEAETARKLRPASNTLGLALGNYMGISQR